MPSLIQRALRSTLQVLLNRVVGKLVAVPLRRHLAQFEAATHRPREVQQTLLQSILAYHKNTAFGRDHGFSTIRTVEDFRRQLPVAGYEAFEPYIARVRRGEINALVADPVVHMFALTSGTTAVRKFIPVTPHYLADYKRGWNLWGLKSFRDHPAIKFRPIVQMSGDWEEFRTEAGIPCGAVTGLTARAQKKIIRWLYCVPACVARIKDPTAKYYAALRLSAPRDVRLMIAANPSTLINLARTMDLEKESLIRDIRDGTLNPRFDIPAHVREELAPRIKKNPERAAELDRAAAKSGTLYPRDAWSPDCLLGNWTGGSMAAYLRHYPRYYGSNPVRDVGLIASEGRMTVPFADGSPAGILDVTTHYFEFIPEGEVNSPRPTVLAAHEVKEGATYYIVPTTKFGLYRYHIHDVVRVTGFHNQTPLVEFLSKGSLFANLTGEKLSEYHVTGAMGDVLREMNLTLTAYSLAPCWNADLPAGDFEQPYYGLFVEQSDLTHPAQGADLARRLDSRLCEVNVEYASKRESGRLGPVQVEAVHPGFWAQWDRERLARTGGTAEQYKHPCLISDLKFHESVKSQQGMVA